ncbi:aspartyl-phosphate phosphatase Spo0E family protein [Paenibacillus pinistramenti]|uniref:aspartyl-phosphate phosphatase Spo0E family protein n=1 Tax=Paenibacillus pinistramenti TaxID=1768003 RepID=UPI0011093653|nr:aspartyl-phosphate phosphatase Spo0E family protein [Paenibacillus pinistramenti]
MNKPTIIQYRIEKARLRLNKMEKRYSLTDSKVIKLSMYLDELINEYMQLSLGKCRN